MVTCLKILKNISFLLTMYMYVYNGIYNIIQRANLTL